MWIKLKCPKCGGEQCLIISEKSSKEDIEKVIVCQCGRKMEIVGEDD